MGNLETDLLHNVDNKGDQYRSAVPPIYQTATFCLEDMGEGAEYRYSRHGNPTRRILEDSLSALEGGFRAFATVSGNAAIYLVLSLLKMGDHIICGNEVHGGTILLIKDLMGKFGIEATFVDLLDLVSVQTAVRPNTRMVWIETPTNPLLKIVDIAKIVEIARYAEAWCVVDNTTMTPLWQKPMDLGVDIVVYSSTKYLNGHSDVIGGAVVAKTELIANAIQRWISLLGIGQSPMDAWLVIRGMKTLAQRLKVHESNASQIAHFLIGNSLVKKVYYPGLENSPGHEIAKKQQNSFGGIVCCELDLDKLDLKNFIGSLKYFNLTHSSGGVLSTIAHLWSTSHQCIPEQERLAMGVTPGLLRLSPGLEHSDDLIKDLKDAFKVAVKEKVLLS